MAEQVVALREGASVLDVGFVGAHEEPGLHLSLRAARPDIRWHAVDIDEAGVRRAAVDRSIVADGARLPFSDHSADAVLFLEVLEHVYGEASFLREFGRVLKPGGILILTTPSAWSLHRFVRWWMPGSMRSRVAPSVARGYLGAHDHVRFLDPLSLSNELRDHGLVPVAIATRSHAAPGLSTMSSRFADLDLRFWPFDRLGGYVCVVARA